MAESEDFLFKPVLGGLKLICQVCSQPPDIFIGEGLVHPLFDTIVEHDHDQSGSAVVQVARVSGGGRTHQAGRDLHVSNVASGSIHGGLFQTGNLEGGFHIRTDRSRH